MFLTPIVKCNKITVLMLKIRLKDESSIVHNS